VLKQGRGGLKLKTGNDVGTAVKTTVEMTGHQLPWAVDCCYCCEGARLRLCGTAVPRRPTIHE
jgi:hypothetical protein